LQRILLIDDSPDVHLLVKASLHSENVETFSAHSTEEALRLFRENRIDLILLDIGLPTSDGFELYTQLKVLPGFDNTSVIFLTAAQDVQSKVAAFELGAEDYIVKPFNVTEFRARIAARLKKIRSAQQGGSVFMLGTFELDLAAQKAFLVGTSAGNQNRPRKELGLTPIEFKLLLLFCRNEGINLSREKILESVWGPEIHVYDRTVDTHVSSLRKKLLEQSKTIQSVSGVGYRLKL
jgi:DNA-binding response OmpR family regulator